MLTQETIDFVLTGVTRLANREHPTRWKYEADILEWGDGEGDIQIIVNVVAVNAKGEKERSAVFPVPVVEEVQDKVYEIAEAIVSLLNATARAEGKKSDWYVYSEPNWWRLEKDGTFSDETNDEHNINTIQWCIFNG